MKNTDTSKNAMDLLERMEKIEGAAQNRRMRMMDEYNTTGPSTQFQKSSAEANLKRIVNDNPTWEQFCDYMNANPQEFTEEERREIEREIETMMKTSNGFERWKDNNITPLSQK